MNMYMSKIITIIKKNYLVYILALSSVPLPVIGIISVADGFRLKAATLSEVVGSGYHFKVLGDREVSSEIQAFVKKILYEIGIENWQDITIKQMSPLAIEIFGSSNAFVLTKTLYINEPYFRELSEDERRFLIGHELMHIKNRDVLCNIGYEIASLASNIGLCVLWMSKMNDKSIKKLQETSDYKAYEKSRDYYLDIVKFEMIYLCKMLLEKSLFYAFRRFQEQRADVQAARLLNAHDDGILFHQRFVQQEESIDKRSWKGWFMKIFRTHPWQEDRVAYLKQDSLQYLQKKQDAEAESVVALSLAS